jgi:hypothetical protein
MRAINSCFKAAWEILTAFLKPTKECGDRFPEILLKLFVLTCSFRAAGFREKSVHITKVGAA